MTKLWIYSINRQTTASKWLLALATTFFLMRSCPFSTHLLQRMLITQIVLLQTQVTSFLSQTQMPLSISMVTVSQSLLSLVKTDQTPSAKMAAKPSTPTMRFTLKPSLTTNQCTVLLHRKVHWWPLPIPEMIKLVPLLCPSSNLLISIAMVWSICHSPLRLEFSQFC